MRSVVQRVTDARVDVEGQTVGQIGPGLLVYLSVGKEDTPADARWTAEKIAHLRVFPDDQGKMNRSLLETHRSVLLISQFTLHGDCRKGRRPGFDAAAPPELANQLYQQTAQLLRDLNLNVATGQFAAHMHITYTNDGPITLLLDSHRLF